MDVDQRVGENGENGRDGGPLRERVSNVLVVNEG